MSADRGPPVSQMSFEAPPLPEKIHRHAADDVTSTARERQATSQEREIQVCVCCLHFFNEIRCRISGYFFLEIFLFLWWWCFFQSAILKFFINCQLCWHNKIRENTFTCNANFIGSWNGEWKISHKKIQKNIGVYNPNFIWF